MSLRRRIAGAAALAVAAVAITLAVVGYLSTRSALTGQLRTDLRARAATFLEPHPGHGGGGGGGFGQGPGGAFPGPPEPGGAAGAFQVVEPNGTIAVHGTVTLPVTQQVLSVARTGSGSVFFDAHVQGTHEEIYAAWDADDQHVVMVALPLTDADSVLSGLLVTYGLLIAGGVLLAGLLGYAISRSALRPIEQFVRKTELVTSELDHPERLEETNAVELRRLAHSFNQTLDALERSIESQRQLVADASHELRTPIAALRSNIQIFLEADRLPEEDREGLQESILAELDELTQVVADVLELARGSAPGSRVEPIELDTFVREAVERTQRRAPDINFKLELEPTVVVNNADRIGRAVTNVVDNARKWSPPDGDIEITLRDGELVVRDHGPGFDERDLPHVFDRFYRADNARRMPGSGLGLAIVKQAAQAFGGNASAGNAPDGGAIITVRFGSARDPAGPPSTPVGVGSSVESAAAGPGAER
ncbi:MAG TPA: HAMP domain-containing sensor histidine kinase [Solirubrobacteraceae bacterium]|nr:HAMP domain-containing sensor histidine kinase [Solirubrobacteraceae bacterium]